MRYTRLLTLSLPEMEFGAEMAEIEAVEEKPEGEVAEIEAVEEPEVV